jgi:hypothetical protein
MVINIGETLKRESIDVNLDAFMQGIQDALSGGKTLLTADEINEIMMTLQKEIHANIRSIALLHFQELTHFIHKFSQI